MNELKTFLEEENNSLWSHQVHFENWHEMEHWVEKHDQRLINKVLEIVKKELADCRSEHNEARHGETASDAYDRIETLLNNLTI